MPSSRLPTAELEQFARCLPSECWQQGIRGGDTLLYFQMQCALQDFPALQNWVGTSTALTPATAAKHSAPASAPPLIRWRDAALQGIMDLAHTNHIPILGGALRALGQASPPAGDAAATAAWHRTDAFDSRPRFGFAGASWMIMYHIGVASALRERWDLASPAVKLAGTSSGSMLAMSVGAGVPLSTLLARALKQAKVCEQRIMGPLGVMSSVSLGGAEAFVPPDAAATLSGRLRVTVTRALPCEYCPAVPHFGSKQHGHVTHWRSTGELLDTCLASSHIPGYFERPMTLALGLVHSRPVPASAEAKESALAAVSPCRECDGPGSLPTLCWDGGLSENIPRWGTSEQAELQECSHESEAYTVTVSPEAQAGTISPPPMSSEPVLPPSSSPQSPFRVHPELGAGGWPRWYSLVPPRGEQYWRVFFAGRGHAQRWMREQGFRPRGQPRDIEQEQLG